MNPPALPADLPNLTIPEIQGLLPSLNNISYLSHGGQKVVFRAQQGAVFFVLKFALLPPTADISQFNSCDIGVRTNREVEIMKSCTSHHMVKLGPINLQCTIISGQKLIYFSEEYIEGKDLRSVINTEGPQEWQRVVQAGLEISDAILALKKMGKIHRDINPRNIMRRDSSGEYVLLDAGLAFDVTESSISKGPVGTVKYFSPEQFEFKNRRDMDFRTDIFSLGVTLYELVTGHHPFWIPGDNFQTLFTKITTAVPIKPSRIIAGVPPAFDDLILRMLGKQAHLRPRTCEDLILSFTSLQSL